MIKRILNKLDKKFLILIFCFSIYTPFLMGIIQEDKAISVVEKRNLAKFPELPESLKEFSEYPQKLTTYYSDHFGFREALTKKYYKLVNFAGYTAADDITIAYPTQTLRVAGHSAADPEMLLPGGSAQTGLFDGPDVG